MSTATRAPIRATRPPNTPPKIAPSDIFFFGFVVLELEPEVLADVGVALALDDRAELTVAVADFDDVELDANCSLNPRLGDIPSGDVVL